MTPKRLFLFAAFDPADNIIDDSLIDYVRALAALGDVVLYMDNDAPKSELAKLKPYVLHAGASAHGEYDFGSYKRGYLWARENDILQNYDRIYLVNDSMYAPLRPIQPLLEDLESRGTDVAGMVFNASPRRPHLQSWFIGMSRAVAVSEPFDSFIRAVARQTDKGMVTWLYEQGFFRLILANKWTWGAAVMVTGHAVYNDIQRLWDRGFPFMKKVSFVRRDGAMGRQILYILNRIAPDMKDAILENARREYGEKHVEWVLTNNPIKIAWRNIRHSLRKLFVEGI